MIDYFDVKTTWNVWLDPHRTMESGTSKMATSMSRDW